MRLSELLEELREGVLGDRSDRVAGTSDYLWTDAQLVRYLNEAQRRLAVKGLVIRDGTTAECCEVTLVEGQTNYTLHPAVLAVISAKLEDSAIDLTRTGHSTLNTLLHSSEWFIDPNEYATLPPGSPVAFTTDEEVGLDDDDTMSAVTLRVYPEPDADAAGTVVKLRVVRKPLDELVATNTSAVPEVPADCHFHLLDWAAYLALRINDQDAGNMARATKFQQDFDQYVREARTAAMRKLFAPTGIVFGRSGWAWGS